MEETMSSKKERHWKRNVLADWTKSNVVHGVLYVQTFKITCNLFF